MKKTLILFFVVLIMLFSGCTEAKFENKFKLFETTSDITETTKSTKPTENTDNSESSNETVIDKNKKMIAFTFDDGPSANTSEILDVFNQYGGKATFFVVGNRLDYNEDALNRIVKEGHEIGSHTWDHTDLTDLNKEGIKNDFTKMRDKISEITGYEINLLRPPYGSYNNTVKSVCKQLNVAVIMWDVDTLDWSSKNKKSIYNNIINEAQNGSIILCHDLYDSTLAAMKMAIPKLVKDGYQLVTVSDLIKSNTGTIEYGLGYFSKNESY